MMNNFKQYLTEKKGDVTGIIKKGSEFRLQVAGTKTTLGKGDLVDLKNKKFSGKIEKITADKVTIHDTVNGNVKTVKPTELFFELE